MEIRSVNYLFFDVINKLTNLTDNEFFRLFVLPE